MAWTDDKKAQAKQMYLDGEPTPENSMELIKEIADALDESVNGVRMMLQQAQLYVKKSDTPKTSASSTKKEGEAPKRVSKEAQIAELKAAIEARGAEVDSDILDKLTGKAAQYFVKVLAS